MMCSIDQLIWSTLKWQQRSFFLQTYEALRHPRVIIKEQLHTPLRCCSIICLLLEAAERHGGKHRMSEAGAWTTHCPVLQRSLAFIDESTH